MSETPCAVGNLLSESAEQIDSWNMRLYVAGQTPKSLRALANLKQICEPQTVKAACSQSFELGNA